MSETGLPRRRVNAGLVRRVLWVSAAGLPFACSVYGPSDLQGGDRGRAGTGGALAGQTNATAGTKQSAGSMNGGVSQTAGTTGESGTTRGGAPALGGTSSGGSASLGLGGEGGAFEVPSGGASAGATSAGTGGGGKGGAGAGGGGMGGAGTGGGGTGGVPAIPGLVASYPCESASGAVLADTSGAGKHASLANGAGGSPVGFSFSSGMVGNALTLSPADQAYVGLPRGIVSQLSQVTIATWVKLKSSVAFQRVFDIGVDTNTFMYLVNAGSSGFVRFRFASGPLSKNQVLEGTDPLPVGKWTHVAVSVGDNGVSIYVDGAQIAQQAPAALRPSDMGDTGNNFIGRSPFAADPYLDGQIDEFRIYNRVLSSAEIGRLAKGQ